jgi:hypothetical protein
MRRIGAESVLIPVTDTDSMREIIAIFRGEATTAGNAEASDAGAPDSSTTGVSGTASLAIVPIVALLVSALVDGQPRMLGADDGSTSTTVPVVAPQQQRLGVFPPDDPSCR